MTQQFPWARLVVAEEALAAIPLDIEGLEEATADLNDAIDAANTAVTSINGTLSTVTSTLADFEDRIAALEA